MFFLHLHHWKWRQICQLTIYGQRRPANLFVWNQNSTKSWLFAIQKSFPFRIFFLGGEEKSAPSHNVVELQHGVGRRVDEDVGQRVLVVVHLVCEQRKRRTSERLRSPPSSSSSVSLHQPQKQASETSHTSVKKSCCWNYQPTFMLSRNRRLWKDIYVHLFMLELEGKNCFLRSHLCNFKINLRLLCNLLF